MFLLMASLPSNFVEQFVNFFTALLVTIPTYFINSLLTSGIIYDVWIGLFGNNDFIQVLFILALILGVYLMIQKQSTGRMKL